MGLPLTEMQLNQRLVGLHAALHELVCTFDTGVRFVHVAVLPLLTCGYFVRAKVLAPLDDRAQNLLCDFLEFKPVFIAKLPVKVSPGHPFSLQVGPRSSIPFDSLVERDGFSLQVNGEILHLNVPPPPSSYQPQPGLYLLMAPPPIPTASGSCDGVASGSSTGSTSALPATSVLEGAGHQESSSNFGETDVDNTQDESAGLASGKGQAEASAVPSPPAGEAGAATRAMDEQNAVARKRYCQPYLVFAAPAADKQYGFNVGNGKFLCVRLRRAIAPPTQEA
jgi:hypothetical protein